jgi:hypothetical protein
MTNAELVAEIRGVHVDEDGGCLFCGDDAPCKYVQLCDRLVEADAEVERLSVLEDALVVGGYPLARHTGPNVMPPGSMGDNGDFDDCD